MAYIGMRNPVFWPISTRTDGSSITYGNPVTIGPAVSANVTFDVADNPDYGDDVIIDNDKGVNGYSVALETNDISAEARAAAEASGRQFDFDEDYIYTELAEPVVSTVTNASCAPQAL